MTDAEISRRLAVAIGWPRVVTAVATNTVLVSESVGSPGSWRKFDYRDPDVIWPIAKIYKVEHIGSVDRRAFCSWTGSGKPYGTASAETVHKAIALAVINAHDRQQRGKQK